MLRSLRIALVNASHRDAAVASRCFPSLRFQVPKLYELAAVEITHLDIVIILRSVGHRKSWQGTTVRDSNDLALLSSIHLEEGLNQERPAGSEFSETHKRLRKELVKEIERIARSIYASEIEESFGRLESWALQQSSQVATFSEFDEEFAENVAHALQLTGFWMLEEVADQRFMHRECDSRPELKVERAEAIGEIPPGNYVASGVSTHRTKSFEITQSSLSNDRYAVFLGPNLTHQTAVFEFGEFCPPAIAAHYLPEVGRRIAALWERAELAHSHSFQARLMTLERGEFANSDVLWKQMKAIKKALGVDGLTLVTASLVGPETYSFRKMLIHYDRTEEDTFLSDSGLAVQSIQLMRPILIAKFEGPEQNRIGHGVSLDPETLSIRSATPMDIEPVVTPKTKEHERSVAYWPIRLDESRYALLKVGSFECSSAFTRKDLKRMKAMAFVILLFSTVSRESAEIRESLTRARYREAIEDKAEALFHYREISLGIFHQLGNYLHIAKLKLDLIEILASSIPKAETLRGEVDSAKTNIRNAVQLIADTQVRGKTLEPLEKRCLLIKDIVLPVLEKQKDRFEQSGVEILRKLGSDDFSVVIDTALAKESFSNLLDNARWAVKENTGMGRKTVVVIVRADAENSTVRILVQDSGIGMDRDTLAKMARFEPFNTRRKGGTGLGLYFARNLFHRFGGDLRIDRSVPNKGTDMSLVLPIRGVVSR